MTYNIHPLFVHFPIALLFLYSLIKVIPFNKWFPRLAWRDLERLLLALGILGAFAALLTGETAEHLAHPDRALVEMHSFFATTATCLYGLLLLGELLALVKQPLIAKLSGFLTHSVISRVLAGLGFIAIVITGVLGGVMVYGPSADPMAGLVLILLGLK